MNNTVELLGFYGGDQTHAISAWTSTSRDYESKKDRMPALLEMLARDEHHTPFEKSQLHFLVNVDQATHIHLLKHRIGVSINGESARYKELKEDKYYIPEDWKGTYWATRLEMFSIESNELYHRCLEELTPILGRKRAKESARFFKTYNSQIQGDVSFNMRSFANFLKLRNSEHAQLEIREVAAQMLKLVQDIPGNPFKHTLSSFNL